MAEDTSKIHFFRSFHCLHSVHPPLSAFPTTSTLNTSLLLCPDTMEVGRRSMKEARKDGRKWKDGRNGGHGGMG
jgi:hypothetical protein